MLSARISIKWDVYSAWLECVLASQHSVSDQDVTKELQTATEGPVRIVAGTNACNNGPELSFAWLEDNARCVWSWELVCTVKQIAGRAGGPSVQVLQR